MSGALADLFNTAGSSINDTGLGSDSNRLSPVLKERMVICIMLGLRKEIVIIMCPTLRSNSHAHNDTIGH